MPTPERSVPQATPADRAAAGDRRPRWRHPLVVLLAVGAGVGLLVLAAVAVAFWRVYDGASIPPADELTLPDPSVLLDAEGEQVETLRPAAVRENIRLEELPDHVPAAVLAAEDRDFEDHRGFSVTGILRAAWVNLRAGEVRQGASTINQQYVAMAVEEIDDSFTGKFREVAVAARLDNELDKGPILEHYLNAVPFGRNAQGIQAAAQTYFGVDAVDLTVDQAATLAGMIAAPSAYDPQRHPERAEQRRDFALRGMVETGALDADTAASYLGADLPELRTEPLVANGPDAYFLEAVRRQLPGLLGVEVDDLDTGLVVHTSLDRRAQRLAVEALDDQLDGVSYSGAVVTVDAQTGAVRALVGGRDFDEQPFDVATQAQRQVGSSYKSFALAELVAQGYDPDATRIDAPRELDIEVEGGDDATIRNFSGEGHGEITVREATRSSINTAYIRMAEELGHDRVVAMGERLGIQTELPAFPSMTLGAGELRPIELTAAYATLANEGVRHAPRLIERVETFEGEVVFDHEVGDGEQVLDARDAAVVTDVLVDAVEDGTGTAADLDRPNAGKTGTTNAFRDAWFVGYTPEYATTVWVGNLDNTPMDGVTGGSLPAGVWGSYMTELVEPLPVRSFPTFDSSHLEPLEGLEAPQRFEPDRSPPPPTPSPAPEPAPDEAPSEDDGPAEDDAPEEDEAPVEDDGDGDGAEAGEDPEAGDDAAGDDTDGAPDPPEDGGDDGDEAPGDDASGGDGRGAEDDDQSDDGDAGDGAPGDETSPDDAGG